MDCRFIVVRATGLEPAHTEVEEPKSSESTNSTTPAYEQPEVAFGCYLFYKIIRGKSRETGKPSLR